MRLDALFAFFLNIDHLAAIVGATGRANVMRRFVLAAVFAADQMGER